MYRSDKLLSNGPRAAGETQLPIAGLDRSIPFRSCQARPAGTCWLDWAGATPAPEFGGVNEWGPLTPSSFLPALEPRTVAGVQIVLSVRPRPKRQGIPAAVCQCQSMTMLAEAKQHWITHVGTRPFLQREFARGNNLSVSLHPGGPIESDGRPVTARLHSCR